MNNKLTSILGGAAVIAIVVVFVLQFRPASQAGNVDTGPTCAAEIRGNCISSASFWASYRLIGSNIEEKQLKGMGMRRTVIDGLVEQWLLNQDAKRLGITVSEEELSRELITGRVHVSLPVDKVQLSYQLFRNTDNIRFIPVKNPKTKKFDEKLYAKNVRQFTRMSPEQFREFQRAELVAARMRDIVRARVHVSDAEAFDQYSREKSTATFEFARFERRFYADVAVDASDKAVEAWADGNKEELSKVFEGRKAQVLPECRVARTITIKTDEMASEDEKAAAKKKAEKALDQLKNGDDFAEVARASSDGEVDGMGGASEEGGFIGCIPKGKLPKPVDEAAQKLAAGKVSDLVKTDHAYWIIKVEQIAKDADAEKLARGFVAKELFIKHEASRLATEAAKQVHAAVKGGKSLKDAIQTHLDELNAKFEGRTKKDDKDKKDKGDKAKDDKAKDKDKKDEAKEKKAAVTPLNHPHRPTLETTLPAKVTDDPIPGIRDLMRDAAKLEKPGATFDDIFATEEGFIAVVLKERAGASKEAWEKDQKEREFYISTMRAAKQQDALLAYVKRLNAQLGTELKLNKAVIEEKAPSQDEGQAPPSPEDLGGD